MYDFKKKYKNSTRLVDLPNYQSILSLLNITEKQSIDADVCVIDEKPQDDLILLHYLELIPGVESVRGIVLDVSNNSNPKMVAKSFPFTQEVEFLQEEQFSYPCTVTKAYEGTILRVFRGKNTKDWYISTHKKIDGRRGRWCGPEFGDTFNQVWGDFPLDTHLVDNKTGDRCWIFLVSHPDSRIVCEIEKPTLRLVGIFENGKVTMRDLDSTISHRNIYIQEHLDVNTFQEFQEQAKLLDKKECTGLLFSKFTGTGWECVKVVPPLYLESRELRGNEPNLRLRYLELREGQIHIDEFVNLYPEKKDLFDEIEWYLKEGIVEYLHHISETLFGIEIIPKEEHFIIKSARRGNFDNIASQLLELSRPRQLNALIKRAKIVNRNK